MICPREALDSLTCDNLVENRNLHFLTVTWMHLALFEPGQSSLDSLLQSQVEKGYGSVKGGLSVAFYS